MKINNYFNKTERYKQFTVLIPCYNEETTIGTVLTNMISLNPGRIVVVDDGSKDKSTTIIKRLQKISPVPIVMLKNVTNGGAGFALSRGFEYCRQIDAEYVVTVDADNQHSKEDTQKIMENVLKSPESVIISGVRKFTKNIPFSKKIANRIARVVFFILYGVTHPDPMCGLRSYKNEVLHELNLEAGYDWVVNVNKVIRNNRKNCKTVKIKAIYTAYSLKKGQSLSSGVGMLIRMVRNRVGEIVDMVAHKSHSHLNDSRVTMVVEKYSPAYQLNVR